MTVSVNSAPKEPSLGVTDSKSGPGNTHPSQLASSPSLGSGPWEGETLPPTHTPFRVQFTGRPLSRNPCFNLYIKMPWVWRSDREWGRFVLKLRFPKEAYSWHLDSMSIWSSGMPCQCDCAFWSLALSFPICNRE